MSTLGVIGSGAIGSGVARLAVAAGMDVVLSNSRGTHTLTQLVAWGSGPAGARSRRPRQPVTPCSSASRCTRC